MQNNPYKSIIIDAPVQVIHVFQYDTSIYADKIIVNYCEGQLFIAVLKLE